MCPDTYKTTSQTTSRVIIQAGLLLGLNLDDSFIEIFVRHLRSKEDYLSTLILNRTNK